MWDLQPHPAVPTTDAMSCSHISTCDAYRLIPLCLLCCSFAADFLRHQWRQQRACFVNRHPGRFVPRETASNSELAAQSHNPDQILPFLAALTVLAAPLHALAGDLVPRLPGHALGACVCAANAPLKAS